jgi:L-malate glycosyltransferase
MPSEGVTSWPQLMEYLLQEYSGNEIDYLICAHTERPFVSKRTQRILCHVPGKVQNKLLPQRKYRAFARALQQIAASHSYIVACVWDSAKLNVHIYAALEKMGLTKRVKLLFYNHGFSHYFLPQEYNKFARSVTEMIMISKHAYRFDFERYPAMPFPVHILYNPINHQLFHPLPIEKRPTLRKQKGLDEKINFLWVGHDKPLKGMDVILEAWKLFYSGRENMTLHIIGAKRQLQIPGVLFHGTILNKELPKWYQAADIIVFSPLRNEGFGLVLSEAISCGCLAIATWGGGMVEFFNEEKHGIAIKEPNFLQSWVNGFQLAVEKLASHQQVHANDYLLPPQFDTYDEWSNKYISIFNSLASRLQ